MIGSKKPVTYDLSEGVIAALDGIARRRGESSSTVAEKMLWDGVEKYRAYEREMMLLGDLPRTMVGVDLDHPIFKKGKLGNGPFEVKVIRTKN